MNVLQRHLAAFALAGVLVVSWICSSSCFAVVASHYQKAERLLVITELPDNLEQLSAIAITVQMEEEPKLRKYEGIFHKFVNQYVSWEVLKDEFVTLYLETFSEGELDQLIDFYSSPLGKKSVDLAPTLMSQTSLIVQQAFLVNERTLDKMIRDYDKQFRNGAEERLNPKSKK